MITEPYQYTNEPNDHFMQMATNLSSLNGQAFVLGRRIHHTSFVDGVHDEDSANGVFSEMVGKSGTHFVNHSCASFMNVMLEQLQHLLARH
ncbi:MAG: di-heme oxidoredictase family protein [Alteromonadaceae bacterium]